LGIDFEMMITLALQRGFWERVLHGILIFVAGIAVGVISFFLVL
jgi:hypothetical protein